MKGKQQKKTLRIPFLGANGRIILALCAAGTLPASAQQAVESIGAAQPVGAIAAPIGPAAGSSGLGLNLSAAAGPGAALSGSLRSAGLAPRPSATLAPAARSGIAAARLQRLAPPTATGVAALPEASPKHPFARPATAAPGGSRIAATEPSDPAASRTRPSLAPPAAGIRPAVEQDLSAVRDTLTRQTGIAPKSNEEAYQGGADLEVSITHGRIAQAGQGAVGAVAGPSISERPLRRAVNLRPSPARAAEPDGVARSVSGAAPQGPSPELAAQVQEASAVVERLRGEVGRVIVGQREMVDTIVMALIAGEHDLLEGAPGRAKTLAVNAVADATNAIFSRIQGTSDKLPSDILGTEILQTDPKTGEKTMKFVPGPVFANIVLVDEINRMTPKTQSALLEAMQERQVTINGKVYELPRPFVLLATQNPLEQEGVNHLPEAQQDRFMIKVLIPRPSQGELLEIMDRFAGSKAPKASKVLALEDLARMRDLTERIHVDGKLRQYITDLVEATHNPSKYGLNFGEDILEGASPRAAIALLKSARIQAFLEGRAYVTVHDIKTVAPLILRHRIILSPIAKRAPDEYVRNILDTVGPAGAQAEKAAVSPKDPAQAAKPAAESGPDARRSARFDYRIAGAAVVVFLGAVLLLQHFAGGWLGALFHALIHAAPH